MVTADDNKPSTESPAYKRMKERWFRCRTLMEGTDAVQKAGELLLPKHPKEQLADYKRRSSATELYNAFARTVQAMAGLVFQRDPTLGDDMNPDIVADWEDIDGSGTHGAVFARRLFEEAISIGLAGVLVDFPSIPNAGQLNLAEERQIGARPYWVLYKAEQIISCRTEVRAGETYLTQLVLREDVEKPVGMFGTAVQCEYRVFTKTDGRVAYSVWTEVEGSKNEWKPDPTRAGFLNGVDEIPFVFLLAGRVVGYNECAPPLLDLADVNLSHYRILADRRWIMHISCVPIPVRKGYRPPVEGEVGVVAPNILQDLPADGSFEWAEIAGTAFGPTKDELDALERRMAALGLAFLESQNRVAQTAESQRISSAAQNASLATAARALGDALETLMTFHAQFRNVEPGSIELNKDYENALYDSGMIQVLSSMQVAGQLSLETLWDLLMKGGVLPPEFDPQAEQDKIMAADAAAAQKMLDQQKALMAGSVTPQLTDPAANDVVPPVGA